MHDQGNTVSEQACIRNKNVVNETSKSIPDSAKPSLSQQQANNLGQADLGATQNLHEYISPTDANAAVGELSASQTVMSTQITAPATSNHKNVAAKSIAYEALAPRDLNYGRNQGYGFDNFMQESSHNKQVAKKQPVTPKESQVNQEVILSRQKELENSHSAQEAVNKLNSNKSAYLSNRIKENMPSNQNTADLQSQNVNDAKVSSAHNQATKADQANKDHKEMVTQDIPKYSKKPAPKFVEPIPEALASVNFHYYLPLHNLASSYIPAERVCEIDKAFVLADKAHAPQKRASGEPYIIHPIAVAMIIAQMHLDTESIVAALLHDTVEDTSVTSDDILKEFGPTVKELVYGVTKLDKLRFNDYREAQAENFRRMILAMTRDIRVILIKLADRTHNMRTLGSLRPDKRKRIARETLEVFAPIANRLGISDIKVELEELGIAALYPMRYRVLKAAVTRARNNRKEVINNILESIRHRLNEVHIPARVLGREKRIYSIYKKMVKKDLQFREIMDVYAFRIILEDVDTCYRVLGQMHNLYKPRPSGFKDYIAIPKINGYQSLHTSLVGPHGVPIEIQIRTEFMDQMSARGVAAHWSYKENGSEPTSTTAQKNAQQWIKNIIDLQQSASSSKEFIEGVKTDLFPDTIFVFAPDGVIFDLPAGSTPVDFAYAVHTDVGDHCLGAKVDHRMYPLARPLKSGQTVEILTSPTAQPNALWLSSVVTPKARSRIKQYLKRLKGQECILIGRRLLRNVLKNTDIDEIPQDKLQSILKELKEPDLNSLFIDVALGNVLSIVVAKKINSNLCEDNNGKPISGAGGLPYTFAQCCLPIPGDEIIGHITSKGLVVHTVACSNVKDTEKDPEKFLKLDWDLSITADMEFQTSIRVELENRQGVLSEISNAVDLANSQINLINSDVKDDGTYILDITVIVKDSAHLDGVTKKIKSVPSVISVTRKG